MSTTHRVVQGEHLSSIAKKHGFVDYRTIWDHPKNAALKAKRKDPNVLFPGDELFIPDRRLKTEVRSTDQRHAFKVRRPSLALRLVLQHPYDGPVANAKCELAVDGDVVTRSTSSQGQVERPASPGAEQGLLRVREPALPDEERAIVLEIGRLNPVAEVSGQRARLSNLGYFPRAAAERDAEAEDARLFRLAIEEFQCEHDLAVDGVCGPKTQAKLEQVHGS